ncbi:MAG TPA: hypothetical protein VGY97_10980 [Solirubrobacteraceae bacterium]|jgi:hypothetical protein|nr:hypothetical protein [Solirubrobacteraceae bacterium]
MLLASLAKVRASILARRERGDVAWREAQAAYRAWANEPSPERYRAFLEADRRWRRPRPVPPDRSDS